MTLKTAFPAPTTKAISSPDSRSDLAGLVVRTTAGVPRAGILPRTTTALVSSRASMGVDVTAFEAVVVRSGLPAFMANDGTVTVPIGNAPVSNSRYDVVYAKQNESSAPFSDGSDTAVFGYVSGTPSATPSEAAAIALVPAGGLPLASILIPSTATTTQSVGVVINQLAPYTALTGGKIWTRNTTELATVTGFAADQEALDISSGFTYRYSGSAWVRLYLNQPESATITGANSVTWTGTRVRKIGNRVFIEGSASRASDITASLVGGTLPAGFRPQTDIPIPGVSFSAGFTPSFVSSIITAGGDIQLNAPVAHASGSRQIFFNISFEVV